MAYYFQALKEDSVHPYTRYYFTPFIVLLERPTIQLNGSVVSWNKVRSALSYVIIVDGDELVNVTTTSFDLSTLELHEGQYVIRVISKGDGKIYIDSKGSNDVAYTVEPQLDTVTGLSIDGTIAEHDEVEGAEVYEYFVDGVSIGEKSIQQGETWIINETPTFISDATYQINFSSNNTEYTTLELKINRTFHIIHYNEDTVYYDAWNGETYRTVTFETAPTGDLLTWLQSNAVKQ